MAKKILDEKWGAEVMAHNYTVIPRLLLRAQSRLKISAMQLAVLLHLIDHSYTPGEMPWPTKRRIAERLQVSTKTVQRAVQQMELEWLIRRERRASKKRGRESNRYDLTPLVGRLKALAPEFKDADERAKQHHRDVERSGFKNRSLQSASAAISGTAR